jgi:hypothetical protein
VTLVVLVPNTPLGSPLTVTFRLPLVAIAAYDTDTVAGTLDAVTVTATDAGAAV